MKRIYSVALMAMLAVCAMVMTSCGDDDEVSDDYTVTIEFTRYTSVNGITSTTYETITKFYQNLLGTDANIGYGTGGYAIITIQGKASQKETVVNKIKNTDSDALNSALVAAGSTDGFTFVAYDGNTQLYTFSYSVSIIEILKSKTWEGTWTGDVDGTSTTVKYTFVVGDKIDDTHYSATMTEDGVSYPGEIKLTPYGNTFYADSPEGENTPVSISIVSADVSSTQFRGQLCSEKYSIDAKWVTFSAK